ncbi:MAG: glycosyltransferase family 39 protein [Acidobacteriota bacterium]|nr:glycosyltransferase family 39 protein [Acidobacteriota bacterium]
MLDALIAALLALAALVALTGGFEIELGSFTLRSHSAGRLLIAAGVVIGIRAWVVSSSRRADPRSLIPDPVFVALLTLIFLSIGYWFKYLLTTIGGADSYGYVSAARMLASGRLIEAAPIADWLSSANRLALTSPLGWATAAGGGGISPTYPLGLPALMAIFTTLGGSSAVYYVSPAMSLLTLWLVFRLARRWGDEQMALLAAALVAWNPVFLTYAKQPMSDAAATAWLMLAFYLAVDDRNTASALRRSALAGAAAGAAFLTRPALIVAVALIPLVAMRDASPFKRMLIAGIGIAVAAMVRLAIQAHVFGNAFTTGYGSTEVLFSWAALPENADIYARQSWRALGGLWLVAAGAGAWVMRGPRTTAILAVAAAVALPYLFYIRFDHWETLRFLLPGLVPLTILVAAGVAMVARTIRVPVVTGIVIVLFAGAFAVRSERLMRESSVWDIQNLEARYPLVGQWFQVNTPPTSVALASQHSGSLRWYGDRQTVRWDLLAPEELIPTVRELEAHGAIVYAALEGTEQPAFDAKFSKELAQLSVDSMGRVRNVNFLRIRTPGSFSENQTQK